MPTQPWTRILKAPRPIFRKGAIVILAAMLFVVVTAMVAFSVDVGYLCVARSQLQNSADAAAMAAAWDLMSAERYLGDADGAFGAARATAVYYAGLNHVAGSSPTVDPNFANDPDGDVVIGRLENPNDLNAPVLLVEPERANCVLVRVRRTPEQNGPVPLFFARVLGRSTGVVTAEAIAAFDDRIVGFSAPAPTPDAGIIPFAMDEDDYKALVAGEGPDNWTYDALGEQVIANLPDGIPEANLFPSGDSQGGITPGNFGTVVLGGDSGASTLIRQIEYGLSQEDLSYYPDGQFRLDTYEGGLEVTGNTGISASLKNVLPELIGQTRIILLYNHVENPGANATFTISSMAGIRILDFSLTGQEKYITIQPDFIQTDGIVGEEDFSYFISRPPHLVR